MEKDEKLVLLVAKVKRGSNRFKIFLAIEDNMMPSDIVRKIYGKYSVTSFNLVSRALRELKELGLVKVLNPKEKTGRVYILTEKGKKIKGYLEN